jgi:hypothetical protein
MTHLVNVGLNSINWWMSLGASDAYAIEGANSYNISHATQQTVSNPEEWTGTLLNGIPVVNNGKNAPMYWTGNAIDDLQDIPGFPATTVCKAIVAFRYHLFALNIDGPSGVFDNMVMFSDAADPGALPATWTPAPSNEAGSLILADTAGRCINGLRLGSQLLVYKPASVYAIEYAGQQPDNIYTQRLVSNSIGLIGPHCVREVAKGSRHIVVGNDDVVLTDGVNLQSIADGRIKYFLANSIDEQHAANSFVIRDLNKREIWVCVPQTGSQFATIAHVFDESRGTWSTRDMVAVRYGTTGYVTDTTPDETWDADSDTWDADNTIWNTGTVGSIARVVNAQSSVLYVEDTTDSTTLTAYVRREDLTFDDETHSKLTQRVRINASGPGAADLQFRLGSRNDLSAGIAWQAYVPAVNADGVPYEVDGRYISIEVRSQTATLWTLDRIQIEARYNGSY